MKRSTPIRHVRRHRSTYTGILLLVLGVLLFHWRGIQPGQVFLPVDLANRLLPWRAGATAARLQNWLISDPLYQFYPFLIQTVASLRGGQLLLWNPALFSGHPALADPLFQTFYPFVTAFGLLLGPARGFSLSLVAHVLLAALLMFGFLCSLRLGLPAAVLGALTYALSGYLVTWFEYPFWLTTLAWLPGILWAWHAGVERSQWRFAGLAGLLLGLALLAGQYQFLLSFVLFWAAYAAACAIVQRRIGRSATFPLGSLLLALCVGALIGAVQVLPFADLLAASRRAAGVHPTCCRASNLSPCCCPTSSAALRCPRTTGATATTASTRSMLASSPCISPGSPSLHARATGPASSLSPCWSWCGLQSAVWAQPGSSPYRLSSKWRPIAPCSCSPCCSAG